MSGISFHVSDTVSDDLYIIMSDYEVIAIIKKGQRVTNYDTMRHVNRIFASKKTMEEFTREVSSYLNGD